MAVVLLLVLVLITACGAENNKDSTNDSQIVEEDKINSEEKLQEKEGMKSMLYTEDTLPNYLEKADDVIVSEDSVTFIDGLGEERTIQKNPKRVVGLYPSHVVFWYEAGGEMVGRITTKTAEERMSAVTGNDIEIVGEGNSPDQLSFEKIMSQKPDIVILGIGSQTSMVQQFAELGVESIVIDNETLTDYMKWVKVISNLNGKPEIYEDTIKNILEPIKELLLKIPAEGRPKMLMMSGNEKGKLTAYLPGTTAGGIADDLGAINIAVELTEEEHDPTKGVDKTDLSFEALLENQPELILIKHSKRQDGESTKKIVLDVLSDNPVWMSLDAVKSDEIYSLPPTYFHYKPTLEYAEAYGYMAKILYPEIFGEQVKDYVLE